MALVLASAVVPLALLGFFLRTGDRDGDGEGAATGASTGPTAGDPAPGFTLTSLDGEEIRLEEHRGSVVLVNFWASWCAPCRKEFPILQEAHDRDGVVVLAVIYNDLEIDARAFIEETGATFPALVDPDGDVARHYGIVGIPQTFLVDREGVVRDRLFGIARRADLEGPLDAVLGDA